MAASEDQKLRSRNWREANKARVLANSKRYYEENKSKAYEDNALWREENKEAVKINRLAYFKDNADKINSQNTEWRHNNLAKSRFNATKSRAKKAKLDFNLTLEDFENIPTRCPVLGVEFTNFSPNGGINPNSASFDRIDNTKGYIKGNVVWVCMKVNRWKSNSTIDELQKLVNFYQTLINSQTEEEAS